MFCHVAATLVIVNISVCTAQTSQTSVPVRLVSLSRRAFWLLHMEALRIQQQGIALRRVFAGIDRRAWTRDGDL